MKDYVVEPQLSLRLFCKLETAAHVSTKDVVIHKASSWTKEISEEEKKRLYSELYQYTNNIKW